MTMQIQIKNADPNRTATIIEELYNIDPRDPNSPVSRPIAETFTLGPNESRSVYIHAGKRVIVTEVP